MKSLPEMMTSCPPALRCLVYLWDQLSSNCVQIVQSNATLSSSKNSPAKLANKSQKTDTDNKKSRKNNKKGRPKRM